MQNAINWTARSASVDVLGMKAHFIGACINELRALDNGEPLKSTAEDSL